MLVTLQYTSWKG